MSTWTVGLSILRKIISFKTAFRLLFSTAITAVRAFKHLLYTRIAGHRGGFLPIRMTLLRRFKSEILTDHDRIKLSSAANMLSELVSRYATVTLVTRLLVQYNKTFDSSYDVSFRGAGVADIAKKLALVRDWPMCRRFKLSSLIPSYGTNGPAPCGL